MKAFHLKLPSSVMCPAIVLTLATVLMGIVVLVIGNLPAIAEALIQLICSPVI